MYGDDILSGNLICHNSAGWRGGGLYLRYSDATLNGNTICYNSAFSAGGGLYLWSSEATAGGNTVSYNTADYGGGLYLNYSDATLNDNTVSSNDAGDTGGGLYLDLSNATLINNVVVQNRAAFVGAGVYIEESSPDLRHTTVASNSGGDGSGVYITGWSVPYSTASLTNTILVSHTVGIAVTTASTATLEGTLWYGNEQDTAGGGAIVTGTVNVHGDPAFVDAQAGDYHIRHVSAAIDAGVDAGVTEDIDGDARPQGAGYDIGADEFVNLAPGAGALEPSVGAGGVGNWVDFTTTYTDPNGYEDIDWAFLFLDRQPPITSGGLACGYNQTAGILWLRDGGVCRPGQVRSLSNDYVTLDCGASSVSGEGDTLTINWRVRPERCFEGGCGWNYAVEFVSDRGDLSEAGLVGWWRLLPAKGVGREAQTLRRALLTEGDLERLEEDIEAWQARLECLDS